MAQDIKERNIIPYTAFEREKFFSQAEIARFSPEYTAEPTVSRNIIETS